MAETLASSIVSTVVGNLGSTFIQNQINLLCGFNDDLNNLKRTFTALQCVLQDAEMKQSKSVALQSWLQEIRDAAYDAQDILDDLQLKADSLTGKSFTFLRKPLLFRFKMAHKVKSVRTKLDNLAKERQGFHLTESVAGYRYGVTPAGRDTSSVMIEAEPYGRQEEMDKIVKELLDDERLEDDLFVYAIWGMGGIGKTTLAQMVYNHHSIQNHFDSKIWLCVSDDFTVGRLVGDIIEKVDGCRSNLSRLDPLQCHLRKKLTKKKNFLLVLDDVWNENQEKWDTLKSIMKCGLKGSVLLATTRNEKIASMMAPTHPHYIGCLNDEDSWSLFRRRAGVVNDDLISIGKKIVKKCGGVPLAIRTLSGVMKSKTKESEWLAIEESEMWPLLNDEKNENRIAPILKLSYYNLHPHMRQCFAYCCIFPKDNEMEVDQLIQLWMANDYIPCDDRGDLLLSGRSIFEELVGRCFFQDVRKCDGGKIICKMHDLMHDLAASVMKNETSVHRIGEEFKIHKKLRHLNIDLCDEKIKHSNEGSLRSILVGLHFHGKGDYSNSVTPFPFNQKYAKALHVASLNQSKFLNSIWKLKHLNYLALSCSLIARLPESLTRLRNLQTLKLTDSSSLVALPEKLNEMKKLWFLEMEHITSLMSSPPGLGELTCLRRLSIFIVGHDASQNITQLKELNHLEGDLVLKGLENVKNLEDVKSSDLARKRNLTHLSFIWTEDCNDEPPQSFEDVLEGLNPHHNIEGVVIEYYQGSKLPNWMGSPTFNKLETIDLVSWRRCEQLLPLGRLPRLTVLKIDHFPMLNEIPSLLTLKELHIRECPTLNEIPCLPTLKELHIRECPTLKEIPCLPTLKELHIRECPTLNEIPCLPTLEELSIFKCNATLLASIQNWTSLISCTLHCLDEVDILPDELLQGSNNLSRLEVVGRCIRSLSNMLDHLPSLEFLKLVCNLEVVPEGLSNLHSLKELYFVFSRMDEFCGSFTTFPAVILEELSSLQKLAFLRCNKLKPLSGPMNRAPPLHELVLGWLQEMEYLPECIQQLTSLQRLVISDCNELMCLPDWLDCLHSLTCLDLCNCEKLRCLPDSFRNLESLKTLNIRGCPELKRRCKNEDGEDWPKISHIPYICIDGEYMQISKERIKLMEILAI